MQIVLLYNKYVHHSCAGNALSLNQIILRSVHNDNRFHTLPAAKEDLYNYVVQQQIFYDDADNSLPLNNTSPHQVPLEDTCYPGNKVNDRW